MEQHKRVLGIIYIVTAALQIVLLLFLSALVSTILSFVSNQVSPDEAWIVELVGNILRIVPAIIIIIMSIPSLIAGIGLLNNKGWALILALVMGCLKLFSFPIGTAIGVYTIWVYSESRKSEKEIAK